MQPRLWGPQHLFPTLGLEGADHSSSSVRAFLALFGHVPWYGARPGCHAHGSCRCGCRRRQIEVEAEELIHVEQHLPDIRRGGDVVGFVRIGFVFERFVFLLQLEREFLAGGGLRVDAGSVEDEARRRRIWSL